MRKGFSPTRSKVIEELAFRQEETPNKLPISKYSNYNKYFCHYNNAVYMGGMSSYKKHGKGILLHDDGSAVITDYLHDTPTGHTIVFRQNSITSILYKTHQEFQVAYKQGKYIITIPFTDSTYKAHGVGVLIDFVDAKIFRLVFKRGVLVEKILHLNKRDNEDLFKRSTATKIIGVKHEQAFNLNFEKPSKVHIKRQKNKTTIGYFDQDGQMHGLNFTFYGQNITANGERSLYLKSIEKGYYRLSRLETFGEKVFSNGNKYIGEFDEGQFHGYGILISPMEMKWVYGKFHWGQLGEIIDSNYKKFTQKDFQVWADSLRHIHRRYKQRWIDIDIQLPQETYIYRQLKEAVERPITHIDPDEGELLRQDEEKMSRIQQQFQKQHPGNYQSSFVQKQLDRHYTGRTITKSSRREDVPLLTRTFSRTDSKLITEPNTPVNELQGGSEPRFGQQQYQMEDPFKINLIKVPFDPQPTSKINNERQPIISRSNAYRRSPATNLPYTKYGDKYYSQYPNNYGDRSRYEYPDHIESIYQQTYLDQLIRQRQRIQRLTDQDQRYTNLLRRGLETSPIHRNYYTSPYKYEDVYPERYNGKITNKRHFNYDQRPQLYSSKYPTTSKYSPNKQIPTYERTASPYRSYGNSSAVLSSSPQTKKQEYSPKKSPPITPKGDEESRRNFIKNNYKYWS